MNREALRATAHNGAVQPVRGSYGAIHVASHLRRRSGVRPWSILFALLVVGGGLGAYFLLAGAFSPQPSLRILSPTSNSTIAEGKLTITVEVRGATLGAAPGRLYHLHYYLDAIVPVVSGRSAIPTTGAWASTVKTSYDWDIRGPGLHVLAVQLVTAEDRPLNPPVVAAITVQVPKSAANAPTKDPTPGEGGC
jgi:hypothetical protein